MSLDTAAVATALETLLAGLPGLASVQIGAPIKPASRVSAYVTMGSQPLVRKNTGTLQREARYYVDLCYRIEGSTETDAETTLMGLVDAFLVALHADLTLGGTCLEARVETGLADEPEYRLLTGKEYREYPIIVTAVQQGGFAVNP